MPPLLFPTILALLLLTGATDICSACSLNSWDDCASFAGFAELNNTSLSCAVAELEPPAAVGLQNATLAWALAQYSGPDLLQLALQLEDASWGAGALRRRALLGTIACRGGASSGGA